MIDIQEARRVTELNKNKPIYLPRWIENYIDDKIMDAASHGKDSLSLVISKFEALLDEEIEAVLEAYADYSPKYIPARENGTFYFFWDED